MNTFRLKLFTIILIVYSFLPSISFSQVDDTSKVHIKGYYISGGVNTISFYNNAYFDYLTTPTPVNPNGNYGIANIVDTFPHTYNHTTSKIVPSISLGFTFYSDAHKNINHIIEASFMQFSGNYSAASNFNSSWGDDGGDHIETTTDTFKYKFIHTAFSIGYKLQPTYKSFFFSLGINCTFTLINVAIQKNKYINGYRDYPYGPPPIIKHPYAYSNIINSTQNIYFINAPFQFGGGAIIKWKCIELKPAFYFSPCFMKGFDIYTVSLGIMYLKH